MSVLGVIAQVVVTGLVLWLAVALIVAKERGEVYEMRVRVSSERRREALNLRNIDPERSAQLMAEADELWRRAEAMDGPPPTAKDPAGAGAPAGTGDGQ